MCLTPYPVSIIHILPVWQQARYLTFQIDQMLTELVSTGNGRVITELTNLSQIRLWLISRNDGIVEIKFSLAVFVGDSNERKKFEVYRKHGKCKLSWGEKCEFKFFNCLIPSCTEREYATVTCSVKELTPGYNTKLADDYRQFIREFQVQRFCYRSR